MASKPPPRKILGPNDPTLDSEELSFLSAEPAACGQVQLVEASEEGTSSGLSCETRTLLRSRLRISALVLCAGFIGFVVWNLAAGAFIHEHHRLEIYCELAVTLILGACGFSLCRSCYPSTKALRIKECIIFGVPAVFFVLIDVRGVTESAASYGVIPGFTQPWLILMFTYALFIPNSWKRAAAVLATMAVMPILVLIAVWLTDTTTADVIWQRPTVVVEKALLMAVATLSTVVGVHTIGSLRIEAFEARQLGQYRLRERLGSGGMGEVFLAEHQLLKRPCAIKVIRPEKAGNPRVLARFEREVRQTAKLSHWNTIEIFDYGRTDDGTFYYVMEYLPGMNLSEMVKKHGPLPLPRVIHLLSQICDALSEAHDLGMVHRDIKPANIFSATRGGVYDVAKLLDFGLVKPLADSADISLTQEEAITGSPLFMSPEQAVGEQPDARSDIYSLGAVAYYLLTGRPPFEEDRPIKVLIAHAHQVPEMPSNIRDDISADIEAVVMRCLAKSPSDRFDSSRSLRDALLACEGAGAWTRNDATRWWRQLAAPRPSSLPNPTDHAKCFT